jgi:hypothetical protein
MESSTSEKLKDINRCLELPRGACPRPEILARSQILAFRLHEEAAIHIVRGLLREVVLLRGDAVVGWADSRFQDI